MGTTGARPSPRPAEVCEPTAIFAESAINEGKAIVDLGCTDSMGDEAALEMVAVKNLERHGDTRVLSVDVDNHRVYSFGDGEKERAYGQVKFGITGGAEVGDISINGIAKENVPTLMSKRTLKG